MITAKVISDSISNAGKRITTMELEYPRFIHAEFMTHRVFSRNAASSRAIPVAQVINQVRNDPAMPIHWGKNQPGMQANEQLEGEALAYAKNLWLRAAAYAAMQAERMNDLGLHKQVANRILEPFQNIKVVVTATEWDNFFKLRDHKDAQPEIRELAIQMRAAMNASTPKLLLAGQWHLPYVTNPEGMTLKQALMISASCCAQVSYRKLDDSSEKAELVYKRLVESEPFHASPFEHQATPELLTEHIGATGNFVGWVQHRKLIEE